MPHAVGLAVLQEAADDITDRVEGVEAYLASAHAGAARVVARKLLDTVVREARAWEEQMQRQDNSTAL